jgi:aminopeptidase N
MGKDNFENFVRDYIAKNDNKLINKEDFLNEMAMKSGYSSSFMETYIQRKMRVNFKIKSFDRIDDQLHIKISKNTTQNIPFKLKTEDSKGEEKHIGMILIIKKEKAPILSQIMMFLK